MFLNSLSKKIKGRKGRKHLQYYEQGMESKGRMFYSPWAESEMVSIGKCEHWTLFALVLEALRWFQFEKISHWHHYPVSTGGHLSCPHWELELRMGAHPAPWQYLDLEREFAACQVSVLTLRATMLLVYRHMGPPLDQPTRLFFKKNNFGSPTGGQGGPATSFNQNWAAPEVDEALKPFALKDPRRLRLENSSFESKLGNGGAGSICRGLGVGGEICYLFLHSGSNEWPV